MIQLNLKPLFALRGIEKPYQYLLHAGFSHHVATNLVAGNLQSLRFEQMERLCHCLLCEPTDLLQWQPNKAYTYPDNYPLSKLLPKETPASLKLSLSRLNFKDLEEMTQLFNEQLEQRKKQ
ncbi:MAG: helix-turn-helix domain-containing protein [Sphingobacteriaceae bacterium]